MSETIKDQLNNYIQQVFSDYGIVIACLVIGILIGWYLKLFVADRKYNQQIKIRIEEKDQRIAELNFLVLERLNKVTVKQQDKSFFKRLKRSFKKFSTKK